MTKLTGYGDVDVRGALAWLAEYGPTIAALLVLVAIFLFVWWRAADDRRAMPPSTRRGLRIAHRDAKPDIAPALARQVRPPPQCVVHGLRLSAYCQLCREARERAAGGAN